MQPLTRKQKWTLFFTGFLQVLLIAINTYQIANSKYIGAVIVGFGISWLWTSNVKKVAFGNNKDRLIYACGASLGTVTGLLTSKIIYEWL
jgi:hypothetical protein